MMIKNFLLVASLAAISANAFADNTLSGYYGSLKLLHARQSAENMNTSSRPGVGEFVSGEEKHNFYNGSLAAGYQFGNGWRTEGEYVFKKKSEYTSGSSIFATSYNHHKVDVQRLMLNVYRDYALGYDISIYGTLGLGLAKVESSGWQGNTSRQYTENTQTNLAYSVGAGVSYAVMNNLSIDLGYRYVDMGNVESGYNNFTNARRLQDEQMKAHLISSEFTLGARYLF
ncbi:ompA-like transmembrane domain protein [Yersinia rohdei]|uniref:OmpA-like transmembrane domain protein n=1 Tax=Yersinia rohdei TaxID=29485 RepID=A0ABM5SF89_YERRO|nr:outer membrane beta-barrel protein [Yersinia rohdei]AJJ11945.1 ompA-like transmembrane domain protein [Yersinia rohdei]EEQ01681.1 Opacity protein and surface antigens-like protein [Yersinia rohdei ATCC 43380]MDN0093119.1 outer membrane beta-barrel protein [Yersinia rohdei]CNE34764.1 Adhesin/invasin protein PagN [Yersinia rohdei]CNJ04439.1 Adhesin/invasin protein PagN [Yersinia rohdei]